MKNSRYFVICVLSCVAILVVISAAHAAKLVYAKNGSGVCGYKDTPVLPWCGFHVHDPDRPEPPRIKAGAASTQDKAGTAPSDAIVLFDGKDLSKWQPSDWKLENGEIIAVSGTFQTKESFGDCQLHLEWQAPNPPQGEMFNRANNGVFLMSRFEIQIFDSYNEKLYPDGQAASIYGQTPPMVNACRKPGQWESYDIIFYAPRFEAGKLKTPARITMFHNGVLVHHNKDVMGPTGHRIVPKYDKPLPAKAPLALAGHHNPVRFRNIWIRPLD